MGILRKPFRRKRAGSRRDQVAAILGRAADTL